MKRMRRRRNVRQALENRADRLEVRAALAEEEGDEVGYARAMRGLAVVGRAMRVVGDAGENLVRAAQNLRDEARRFEWPDEVLEYASQRQNPDAARAELRTSRERAYAYVDSTMRNVETTVRDGDVQSARMWYERGRDAWASYVAQVQRMREQARNIVTSDFERGVQRAWDAAPNPSDLPTAANLTTALVVLGGLALFALFGRR
jgi:hypothetical protein